MTWRAISECLLLVYPYTVPVHPIGMTWRSISARPNVAVDAGPDAWMCAPPRPTTSEESDQPPPLPGTYAAEQGLTRVHVRAQLDQLQHNFMTFNLDYGLWTEELHLS